MSLSLVTVLVSFPARLLRKTEEDASQIEVGIREREPFTKWNKYTREKIEEICALVQLEDGNYMHRERVEWISRSIL